MLLDAILAGTDSDDLRLQPDVIFTPENRK